MALSSEKKDEILKTAIPSCGIFTVKDLPDSCVIDCLVEMTVADFKAINPSCMNETETDV